ncbi:MAG: alpha/beta hydrolase [Bryobacter sp.]|jgi:pimeloyl-ACP methyl ester carboxylesterase|nr:alpha/beta hydrolase [Bryobacter sp. CoA8 C33]
MVFELARRYERKGLREDAAQFPAPGFFVHLDGRPVHVYRRGESGPPVIFEAGIAATSLSWRLVEDQVARFATLYSYDRAGFGWSAPSGETKVARALVEEMRRVMEAASVPVPRYVVGHSFGGMMMRMYAAMYPEEVSGVLLVDALPPEEWFPPDRERLRVLNRAVELTRRGSLLADLGVVRFALRRLERGQQKIPKILSLLAGAGGAQLTSRITGQIRKLPFAVQQQIRAHWSRASSFTTMAEYLVELPASCAQAAICADLGDKPLIVLSAEYGKPGHQGRQAKLARLSRRGDFRVVPATTHWIMLDDPDSVVEAVRDLLVC